MRSAILSVDLRDLPFGARAILQGVHDLMREARRPVLRTGDHPTDRPGLAAKLGLDVVELEAHLPALLVRQLLTEEPDGALSSPTLAAQEARREDLANRRRDREERVARGEEPLTLRAAASRANGGLGGRPPLREGPKETPEAAPQTPAGFENRNLECPLGSDLGFPSITQRVSSLAKAEARARAKLSTQATEKKEFSELGAGAREAAETHRENLDPKPRSETHGHPDVDVETLARDLLQIAGLVRSPNLADQSTVRGWLAQGLEAAAICNVVRERSAAAKGPIGHLGYFKKALGEAARAQLEASASGFVAASSQGDHNPQLRRADDVGSAHAWRTTGLRPAKPPERDPQEDDESYGRRAKVRFDIEVKTAQQYGGQAPDWPAFAAIAGLPAELAAQLGA